MKKENIFEKESKVLAILVSVLTPDKDEHENEVSLDELESKIPELLKAVHDGLYEKALERRNVMTYDAKDLDEMKEIADNKPGFIRAMWWGDSECEDKLKEVAGVTSRCIPFEQEEISGKCVCCGKEAKHMLYWGKAY